MVYAGKVRVRRSTVPQYGLFGFEYWWEVWVTPFQCVATFRHHGDAVHTAHQYATHMRRQREQARAEALRVIA